MKTFWKLFIILLLASILGAAAITPYTLTLQGIGPDLPVPFYVLLLGTVIQNALIFAVFIFLGLKIAKKVGLGLPVLEDYLEGREVKSKLKSIMGISVGLGLLAGVLIIGFDYLFSQAGVAISLLQPSISPPAWQGFLASFYGGINEEITLRLFFMSLVVWIIYKIKSTPEGKPTPTGVWLAIIISAVLFGLGHLPVTSSLTDITPLVVLRAVLLNGIGGVIFGWLYWKKGLESAMISHFSADIVLHVLLPLLI
ncbi:CPBP family intramembrane metalloprotease [Methanobacterium movens]